MVQTACSVMRFVVFAASLATILLACVPSQHVQHAPGHAPSAHEGASCASPAECERWTAASLDALRTHPLELSAMLHDFPKGGDLHNHVSGAVYAESYLAWAHDDGLLVDHTDRAADPSHCPPDECAAIPASPADPRYGELVRAWSMEGFRPDGESGHDHFFATFGRFGAVSHESRRQADMLAEAMRRAWDEHALYLEIMVGAVSPTVTEIVRGAGTLDANDLSGYELRLHSDPRWDASMAASQRDVADTETGARRILRCDTPAASPVCGLTVRYISQVSRTSPPANVFAELLASYEVSAIAPRVVGVNLVAPEDDATAGSDYALHMAMLAHLREEFAGRSPMRITLHAGELTPTLAGPAHSDWLRSHVRDAIEIAHAERIGHGVDVMGERDAQGLLAEMHERRVTVEICLTSNALILGVYGAAHPLAAYLAAGVPVVLATDDAGVSRSSLTGEFVRAVAVQGLTYAQLKAMARQSLTAAFLSGAERARLQSLLEDEFTDYERRAPPP